MDTSILAVLLLYRLFPTVHLTAHLCTANSSKREAIFTCQSTKGDNTAVVSHRKVELDFSRKVSDV